MKHLPALAAVLMCLSAAGAAAQDVQLGPRDGAGLPPVDTGRVAIGDPAPDFALRSLAGPTITLSEYRGKAIVILVFYRGHW